MLKQVLIEAALSLLACVLGVIYMLTGAGPLDLLIRWLLHLQAFLLGCRIEIAQAARLVWERHGERLREVTKAAMRGE